MEEQLPTPLIEIIQLNLYLSSITIVLALVSLFFILKFKDDFSWTKFSIVGFTIIICSFVISIFLWSFWTTKVDIMFGPLNLPFLIPVTLFIGIYSKFAKTKRI